MKTKRAGGEIKPPPLKLFFVRGSVKHTRAFKSVVKNLRDGFARNGLLPPIIARAVAVENALSLAEFRASRAHAEGVSGPCRRKRSTVSVFFMFVQFSPGNVP